MKRVLKEFRAHFPMYQEIILSLAYLMQAPVSAKGSPLS